MKLDPATTKQKPDVHNFDYITKNELIFTQYEGIKTRSGAMFLALLYADQLLIGHTIFRQLLIKR